MHSKKICMCVSATYTALLWGEREMLTHIHITNKYNNNKNFIILNTVSAGGKCSVSM